MFERTLTPWCFTGRRQTASTCTFTRTALRDRKDGSQFQNTPTALLKLHFPDHVWKNDIKEIIVFCVINHYENWTLFVRQISNSKETCFQFCLRSWCPVIPQPVQVVPLPSIMLRPTQQSLAWPEFQNLQSFVRFWVVWDFLVHVVGRVIAQPIHPTHRQNLLHFVFGPLSKVL